MNICVYLCVCLCECVYCIYTVYISVETWLKKKIHTGGKDGMNIYRKFLIYNLRQITSAATLYNIYYY